MRIRADVTTGLLVASLFATNPAWTQDKPAANPVGGVVSQPFKDLNLVRERTPEILARVEADPYRLPDPLDCGQLTAEIAELEAVLGPDVDDKTKARNDGGDLVSDALRSALGLPMRGVVRRISGADKRARLHARAVLAGIARRSFLKGVARTRCPTA